MIMPAGKPFTPEEIEKINSMPMNFVLGKERSGTTLLQLMLNVHPGIVAPPESRFIILLFYKYGRIKQWTEKIIVNFCNDLFKEALFRNFWSVIREELQADLLASRNLLTF